MKRNLFSKNASIDKIGFIIYLNNFYLCNVKRVIAFSFLLIFLTSSTAFGQLLRLPALIDHYVEHANLGEESVFEFLCKHYSQSIDHTHGANQQHEKLPFKTEGVHTIHFVTLAPQSIFTIPHLIPELVEIPKAVYKQQQYLNASLDSIWQPPRFS